MFVRCASKSKYGLQLSCEVTSFFSHLLWLYCHTESQMDGCIKIDSIEMYEKRMLNRS